MLRVLLLRMNVRRVVRVYPRYAGNPANGTRGVGCMLLLCAAVCSAEPAKHVRTAARPTRQQAQRSSWHNRSVTASRLPLYNRSSRAWYPALVTGTNCTVGTRTHGAWAAGSWDQDCESGSRPLPAKWVRLVLSSSVAHYETAVRPCQKNEDPCHLYAVHCQPPPSPLLPGICRRLPL